MRGLVWKQFKIQNIFKLDAVPCRYCLTLILINIRGCFIQYRSSWESQLSTCSARVLLSFISVWGIGKNCKLEM
jgi:hypothetical protein